MTKVTNLEGLYKVRGKTLTSQDTGKPLFIVSTRTNVTPTKPDKFLLLLDERQGRTYVSSLYQDTNRTYHFDYEGVNYVFDYTSPETVCITLKTGDL
mgnify:CR=1 FL=1